jgi:hypothetical protein
MARLEATFSRVVLCCSLERGSKDLARATLLLAEVLFATTSAF